MNYFSHGCRFLDDPYFLAGTAVPDLLNVVDRNVKARSVKAKLWCDDPDPKMAALARGVVQHHADDHWFHGTRAFTEVSGKLTVEIRARLPLEHLCPAWFLGHILVEILLDSRLILVFPGRLDRYYDRMSEVDGAWLEEAVSRIAGKPAAGMQRVLAGFQRWRFLSDYQADDTLRDRLNNIMQRVGLPPLPDAVAEVFPSGRAAVQERLWELLPFGPDALD